MLKSLELGFDFSTFLPPKDVLHLSANAGMRDKFTLQISGFLKDS